MYTISDLGFDFPQFTKPPIIIGGCGRSGTGLMLSVLSAHESILSIPFETLCFCPGAYPGSGKYRGSFDLTAIRHFLIENWKGERRWCEKTPKNVKFYREIIRDFGGDVKIINMVRDGRDVILSKHPNSGGFWVNRDRWISDAEHGMMFENCPEIMTVRYEDLVCNFNETICSILAFLDEEPTLTIDNWYDLAEVREHSSWVGEVSMIHTNSVGRWREPKYLSRISQLMGNPRALSLLEYYGYI